MKQLMSFSILLFCGLVFYLTYSVFLNVNFEDFYTQRVIVVVAGCTVVALFYYLVDKRLRKGLRVGYEFYDGSVTEKIGKNNNGNLTYGVYELTFLSIDRQGTCVYEAKNMTKRKIVVGKRDKYVYYNVYTKRIILPTGKVSKRV